MTLSKALLPSASILSKAFLVLGGTALIAAASQVQVPMIPVPMTLQTLAVLLVGLTLGARMGAATLIAYLAEGAAGLPVFAGGANGAAMFGPTAGFLFGYTHGFELGDCGRLGSLAAGLVIQQIGPRMQKPLKQAALKRLQGG